MAIAPFCTLPGVLHQQTLQSIQHLNPLEPALPVEQPSHLQWVDLLSVLQVASKDPSALQRMAFRLASPKACLVSMVDSVCTLNSTVAADSAAAYFLPAAERCRIGAAAFSPCSKNVECAPLNRAMCNTALRAVIHRDIFIELALVTRLHSHVRSRVRLVLAHVLAQRPPASTAWKITQPRSVPHLGQNPQQCV